MAEYLFSRVEGAPRTDTPVEHLEGLVFFQMWRTRQDPYNTLEDGDTLWWTDQRSREVRWELRVVNLRRRRYTSHLGALELLRRWTGLVRSDLNDYVERSPNEGWLLGWQNDVIGPIGVVLPHGERLGQNGFRRLSSARAREIDLPVPGRPALITMEPQPAEPAVLALPATRYIPMPVRAEVLARDGRRCARCGTTDGQMHFDHIFPWSKGGPNTAENLQVLCQRCNLEKGTRASGDVPSIPLIPEVLHAATVAGRRPPSSVDELTEILLTCVREAPSIAAAAVWALWYFPDAVTIVDQLGRAIATADPARGSSLDLFRLAALNELDEGFLEQLLASEDQEVAERAIALLLESNTDWPIDRLLTLARRLTTSEDVRLRSVGCFYAGFFLDYCEEADRYLRFAAAHGDPVIACASATTLGCKLDEAEAFYFLDQGMRSPVPEHAAAAADAFADLFETEPDLSNAYKRRAEELRVLAASVDPLVEPSEPDGSGT